MKKTLSLTLVLALSAGLLAGCGSNSDGGGSGSGESEKRVLNVCSWGEYIDPSLEKQFEEATGIEVNYQTVPSNEELYSILSMGGANYDVIVPSDYMISQLIEEDMLQPLDYDKIPNFSKIASRFKNLSYDPENLYTVPYAWGTLGIIYDSSKVDAPITSWGAMFDTQYADQVLMINNSRDALGIALMYLGYSVNTDSEEELRAAYDLLATAKQDGVYQAWVMDEVFGKMESGEATVATYYAGDYLTMLEANPNLEYVVPEEGSNWFVDAMCILKDAENVDEAHEWIDFICSTDASLKNMDFIWYASPNEEALEQYPAYYEETYGEPLDMELYEIMAAPQEVLENCEAYLVRPAETRALYNDLWTELGIIS